MEHYLRSRHFAFWIVVLTLLFSSPTVSYAQWRVWTSYQYRFEEPSKGISAQLDRQFSTSESWLDVFVRGTTSYFFIQKERHTLTDRKTITKTSSFDFTLSGGVGVSIRRFYSYIGLGGGHKWTWERSVIQHRNQVTKVESDIICNYISRYIGIDVEVSHGVSLYGEYRRPFYLNEVPYLSDKIEIGLGLKF